jgi:nitroreductase
MLRDLVLSNRSYRTFAPDVRIPEERVRAWIDLARRCPSARNAQPLKYAVVTDEETCAKILPHTYWARSLGIQLPPEGHTPVAYVVICHDTSICAVNNFSLMDVGICAQTLLLAANEEGFGGCMIGSMKADEIREILSIPAHLTPLLTIGLGKPDESVVLTEAKDGEIHYYRDEANVHYVPKRPLDEIIL